MADDIAEVAESVVDDIDVSRVESEAERLGITQGELVDRINLELRQRLAMNLRTRARST